MAFEKGNKYGKGRPPILLPEVQSLIEKDKNAVRVSILSLLNLSEKEFEEKSRTATTVIEKILCQCIERIGNNGDIQGLRMLLEIPLGKLPGDAVEFHVSEEEKDLIARWRAHSLEQTRKLPEG